ncbi:protein kinase C and casein kinase substrate in neurons protein 1-like isoform X2 [Lineus longissimus]|uniref:protein kinase C and casein kinase substrate in neurons protein 1-like isoform X2 n=1 Tax=Lineus longissimus TaxID=88925 RepID=UPI002B4F2D05
MSVIDDQVTPSSDSFWEVGQYKRTVKRIQDEDRLCNDLMTLIQERSDIEKVYAKNLRQWSKKWTDHIKSGPEYGTTEAAWNGVMREAERLCDIHLDVRSQLMNEVLPTIKQWQKEHFHKNMMGVMKESKDMDDNFRRAQKPWAKKLSKVVKGRKDYHSACKTEKSARLQKMNAEGDSSISPEQVKKLSDKVDKCEREVEITKDKYNAALADLNSYNAKYIEEMKDVFDQCQDSEQKRLQFFKEMLYGVHKCLNISDNEEFPRIYGDLYNTIGNADYNMDLRWWSQNHGVDMPMSWPVFEEFSPEVKAQISDKRGKSFMKGGRDGDEIMLKNYVHHDKTPSHVSDTGSDNASYTNKQEYTKDYVSKTQSVTVESALPDASSSRPRIPSYDHSLNPFGTDDKTPTPDAQSKVNPQNPFGDDLEVEYDLTDDGTEGQPVRALYDYSAVEQDELEFKAGDIFSKLSDEDEQGWCKGRKNGRIGLYPANYAEAVN